MTLADYHSLALQAGSVAKVRARTTGWNRIDLYVAPEGDTFTQAPDELKRRLVSYFETRRMVGTSVFIRDPVPVAVDISVELVTEHNFPPETVRQRVAAAVADLLAFRNVDFARPVYLSKVYEAVEAIDGVLAATVTRFRRQDQAPPRTLRRKVLLDAGLGEVSGLIDRAYSGEIAVEGRIDIGEIELPVPGAISVTVSYEARVRVGGFRAESDIVGRRVKVSWDVQLDEGEGLGAAPALVLRRKQRDFEFPDAGADDPFLVYDSAAFPPAGAEVTEIDLGEAVDRGIRTVTTAESVSREIDGVAFEVLRRTRTVSFDAARNPSGYREEILDVHDRAAGLEPGTTSYYELAGDGLPGDDPEAFRAVATPTEVHRSGRMLYDLLPAIVRRHDVSRGAGARHRRRAGGRRPTTGSCGGSSTSSAPASTISAAVPTASATCTRSTRSTTGCSRTWPRGSGGT